jgi:transcriptional regulator with XRE-family HTH domain
MPTIIEFLGPNPLPSPHSFSERLAVARPKLGLSQRKIAAKLGVDQGTVQGWETGRHQPTMKSLGVVEEVPQKV